MKNKKTILIITAVAIFLIVVAVLWYYLKPKSTTVVPLVQGPAAPSTNVSTLNTSTPTANDSFPLVKGSKGDNVKYLQQAINRINPNASLSVDGDFQGHTYTELLLAPGLGTKYYPVTVTAFNAILSMANGSSSILAPTLPANAILVAQNPS